MCHDIIFEFCVGRNAGFDLHRQVCFIIAYASVDMHSVARDKKGPFMWYSAHNYRILLMVRLRQNNRPFEWSCFVYSSELLGMGTITFDSINPIFSNLKGGECVWKV